MIYRNINDADNFKKLNNLRALLLHVTEICLIWQKIKIFGVR